MPDQTRENAADPTSEAERNERSANGIALPRRQDRHISLTLSNQRYPSAIDVNRLHVSQPVSQSAISNKPMETNTTRMDTAGYPVHTSLVFLLFLSH